MMNFSDFGRRFTGSTGISRLMDDLGNALALSGDDLLMLGGGNPAAIPEVQACFRDRMATILADQDEFERLVGNYDAPQGNAEFIDALAELLRVQVGWDIGPQNIALTVGSQSSFFLIFNLFAGRMPDGRHKRVLLPLAPEYIGYADVGLSPDQLLARRPTIEHIDPHTFKYHVDLDNLAITDDIGAICVSRPTNPTGNVLSDAEVDHLTRLSYRHGVPLIIDSAYGAPFPNIVFGQAALQWNEQTIICMSLSKLGLPGARTGMVIANETVIRAISAINAVFTLATSGFGAALALDLVRSGQIIGMSRDVIKPFYQQRAEQTVDWLHQGLAGCDYHIHKAEGAIFLWLWFRDLPISSEELYRRLKHRGVLIVPGHYFFPGLAEDWQHRHECIRMTYSQPVDVVTRGVEIICDEVKKAYKA